MLRVSRSLQSRQTEPESWSTAQRTNPRTRPRDGRPLAGSPAVSIGRCPGCIPRRRWLHWCPTSRDEGSHQRSNRPGVQSTSQIDVICTKSVVNKRRNLATCHREQVPLQGVLELMSMAWLWMISPSRWLFEISRRLRPTGANLTGPPTIFLAPTMLAAYRSRPLQIRTVIFGI